MEAVAVRDGKPTYTQPRRVPGFTKEAIRDYASANIAKGSWVFSDGLGCFLGLVEAGMKHAPVLAEKGRPKNPLFKWVDTTLGKLKSAIFGARRNLDGQHTARYLAAYEWRFNPPFDLKENLARLARVAVKAEPRPYAPSPRFECRRRRPGSQVLADLPYGRTCPLVLPPNWWVAAGFGG